MNHSNSNDFYGAGKTYFCILISFFPDRTNDSQTTGRL